MHKRVSPGEKSLYLLEFPRVTFSPVLARVFQISVFHEILPMTSSPERARFSREKDSAATAGLNAPTVIRWQGAVKFFRSTR